MVSHNYPINDKFVKQVVQLVINRCSLEFKNPELMREHVYAVIANAMAFALHTDLECNGIETVKHVAESMKGKIQEVVDSLEGVSNEDTSN